MKDSVIGEVSFDVKVSGGMSESNKKERDARFVCPKCSSRNVVLRPMYGSVSRCKDCNFVWSS